MPPLTIQPGPRPLTPQNPLLGQRRDLFPTKPSNGVRERLAAVDLTTGEKRAIKSTRVITKHDYPALVTLKLAGRQEKDIARIIGATVEQIRPHLARAIAEYREGRLKIDRSAVREEATKKAGEEGCSVMHSIADAAAASAVVADAVAEVEAAGAVSSSSFSVVA